MKQAFFMFIVIGMIANIVLTIETHNWPAVCGWFIALIWYVFPREIIK